ncbi:cupin domain-containing protein [Zhouia amylolytica]|uniref:Cupin 2 conserved barrel domain-containing protein n=1 Tax=Zhouia amylolytica AD3 TaxID=1286632 RepID=W2USF3_9FLAO|nr:hypothetical protein [Zhouia amylolytica]ETN97095.1 hypothetical protein P278_05210 [Zhouia amylolytica AD3]
MNDSQFKKLISFDIAEKLTYTSNAISKITVLKKKTGEIKAMSFDIGMELAGEKSASSIFFQIIEGNAKIIIDDEVTFLKLGDTMVIPKHTDYLIIATQRFKMLFIDLNLELNTLHLNKKSTENKRYKAGQTVYSKVNPTKPLIVRAFLNKIYYCFVKDSPEDKEEVYFERELTT